MKKLFALLSAFFSSFVVAEADVLSESNPVSKQKLQPQQYGEVQIGSSFFESTSVVIPVRQVGFSYEDRPNMSDIYVFYNQLLANNVFYEVRSYLAYNYKAPNPILPSIPLSNNTNPPGYGFVGIVGYNIPLNENVTILPYIRLNYYYDFAAVYNNTNGDTINSNSYITQLGARLSLKVNNVFDIYANYFAGYQWVNLSGGGAYTVSDNPAISGFVSTLELGMPYKMTRKLSITPYVQFNVTTNNPNTAANNLPYSVNSLTNANALYAFRFSYAI